MKNLIKTVETIEEAKEYFENRDYSHTDDVVIGEFALYADGYQDPDFFEIKEENGELNIYAC